VGEALAARGGPEVPHNFMPTAPGHDGRQRRGVMPTHAVRNPQVRPGFLWPHEAPAGGGRYQYRAPCPRLIGSCLDLASPTKGRILAAFTAACLQTHLACRQEKRVTITTITIRHQMTFRWDKPITWLLKQGSEDKPGWVYGTPSHFVLGDLEMGRI
jgi:hypothetical protein